MKFSDLETIYNKLNEKGLEKEARIMEKIIKKGECARAVEDFAKDLRNVILNTDFEKNTQQKVLSIINSLMEHGTYLQPIYGSQPQEH